MIKIPIQTTSKNYDVCIGKDLLDNIGSMLKAEHDVCKLALITDDTVQALYADQVKASLESAGFAVCCFAFPAGEGSKNIRVLTQILEFLAQNELTRSDLIVALGGGVTGDLTGFAAGVYLRGVAFVQLPTTLLAAVDSSVGGKTGVNLQAGKNLAGVFNQPELVVCDINTLRTLSDEIISDGMAEVIKYGMIGDKTLFDMLMKAPFAELDQQQIIARCVKNKGELVCADEFDRGSRQLLNFGHTIGHAIERCSGYTITHGHAVAIGMMIMAKTAVRMGWCEEADCVKQLEHLLIMNGLPVHCPYTVTELMQGLLHDKKRHGKDIAIVVPKKIGACYLHTLDVKQMESVLVLN